MTDVPDPKTWATGGDPATEKQKSFLSTLASEKGESIDTNNIEKGPASMEIERLKDLPSGGQSNETSPAAKADQLPAEPLSTSDDAATDKQKRYLSVLEDGSGKDGEDEKLSKAEASQKIASLKSS